MSAQSTDPCRGPRPKPPGPVGGRRAVRAPLQAAPRRRDGGAAKHRRDRRAGWPQGARAGILEARCPRPVTQETEMENTPKKNNAGRRAFLKVGGTAAAGLLG